MMGQYGIAAPKGQPRVRAATRRRREQKVIERVSAFVATRDPVCRACCQLGPGEGVLEWAHLGDSRRFKTRGQPPEIRHTSAGSLMLCSQHHSAYDAHEIEIEELSALRANGPLVFLVRR